MEIIKMLTIAAPIKLNWVEQVQKLTASFHKNQCYSGMFMDLNTTSIKRLNVHSKDKKQP